MMFYLGFAYNTVHKSKNDEDWLKSKGLRPGVLCNRAVQVMYVSLRSFASGDVDQRDKSPTKAEKIMISGFVVFTLVIISVYTANLAAFILIDERQKWSTHQLQIFWQIQT